MQCLSTSLDGNKGERAGEPHPCLQSGSRRKVPLPHTAHLLLSFWCAGQEMLPGPRNSGVLCQGERLVSQLRLTRRRPKDDTPPLSWLQNGATTPRHRLLAVVVCIKGNGTYRHAVKAKGSVRVQGCDNSDCYTRARGFPNGGDPCHGWVLVG